MRALAVILTCLMVATPLFAKAEQVEVGRAEYYGALFELVRFKCPDVAQQVDAVSNGFVSVQLRNEWTQEFGFEPTLDLEYWPLSNAERHALAFELAITGFLRASVNATGHMARVADSGPQNDTTHYHIRQTEAAIAMLHCLRPNMDELAEWTDDQQQLLGSWLRVLDCEPFWARYPVLFDLARTRVVDHRDVGAIMVDVSDKCEEV